MVVLSLSVLLLGALVFTMHASYSEKNKLAPAIERPNGHTSTLSVGPSAYENAIEPWDPSKEFDMVKEGIKPPSGTPADDGSVGVRTLVKKKAGLVPVRFAIGICACVLLTAVLAYYINSRRSSVVVGPTTV